MYWIKVKYLENYSSQWPPLKKEEGNVCFDLRAAVEEKTEVLPGEIKKIPLGVKLEPSIGCGVKIYPRSGMASLGLGLANSVGIIDNDYRGEVVVPVLNMNLTDWLVIWPGDRIVQGELTRIKQVVFCSVDELTETERGDGSFGSTGKK